MKHCCLALFAFASLNVSAVLGDVVFSVTGNQDPVLRPVSVTNLTVSGTAYNVTITYNISINVNTSIRVGDLPDGEDDAAGAALLAAINTAATAQGIDSNETEIYFLANTQPANASNRATSLGRLADTNSPGVGDFQFFPADGFIFLSPFAGRPSRGSATFTIPPVPEPSTALICATVALAAVLRRRRQTRTTRSNTSS